MNVRDSSARIEDARRLRAVNLDITGARVSIVPASERIRIDLRRTRARHREATTNRPPDHARERAGSKPPSGALKRPQPIVKSIVA
jgi:hypothetical protein